MKKIFLLLIILFIVGCSIPMTDEEKRIEEAINNPATNTPEPTPTPYIDTNPIKVGIYKDYKLIHEYNKKFKDQTDIAIFNVVFSNDESLTKGNNYKTTWKKYYDQYENIDEYKVGFEISFDVNHEHKELLLLDPKGLYDLDPYLYPFLYDDINNSGYYSHVTTKDVKDNTVYSSIKLYLHQKTNEITSPITLTAFTYKGDIDFKDGHYRGNSSYTITINNK